VPSATATTAETVERTFKPLQQFTRGWMMAEATDTYGVEVVGMRTGREFWVVGRAGVMGSCTPEVAAGALAFHAPDHVYEAWTHLPEGMTHFGVAEHYASRVLAWGEAALTPVFDHGDLARIDTLGRRIIDAAPSALGGIFAGWRALPRPDDLGARVALTTQILREMRGAAHIHAILSVGITPLDAILASTNAPPRTGPGYAERMGFTGPFRDPEEVRPQRLEAEAVTARIMEAYYAVLSPEELADFGDLVERTRNAIDM
jgi:hypothetical protein